MPRDDIRWLPGTWGNEEANAGSNATIGECVTADIQMRMPESAWSVLEDLGTDSMKIRYGIPYLIYDSQLVGVKYIRYL